jgi:hypothetical protein
MSHVVAITAVTFAAAETPTLAHHSFSMFDAEKTVTLTGNVKDWQWTNPHSWIQLDVAAPGGGTKEWSIELASPAMLGRAGWKHNTLNPGDKLIVTIHPLKDGTSGGQFVKATTEDGKTIGRLVGPGG